MFPTQTVIFQQVVLLKVEKLVVKPPEPCFSEIGLQQSTKQFCSHSCCSDLKFPRGLMIFHASNVKLIKRSAARALVQAGLTDEHCL